MAFSMRVAESCRQKLSCVFFSAFVLLPALLAAACGDPVESRPSSTGPLPAAAREAEECSLAGAMACRAMSLFAGAAGEEPICTVYMAVNGSRVEKCGQVPAAAQRNPAEANRPPQTAASSGRNVLTWSDNSDDESGFVIERCDRVEFTRKENAQTASCAGAWKAIGTVPANVTRYVDDTASAEHVYLYRIKASNNSGNSAPSNEAVITTPHR